MQTSYVNLSGHMVLTISDEELKARILHKLARHRMWGGKHTSFENLAKSFNVRHLGKEGYRRIDKIGKELINEGFLLSKPTSYGLEVSLNPNFKGEIIETIEKHMKINKWEKEIYFR